MKRLRDITSFDRQIPLLYDDILDKINIIHTTNIVLIDRTVFGNRRYFGDFRDFGVCKFELKSSKSKKIKMTNKYELLATFEAVRLRAHNFCAFRNWEKFHLPTSLTLALSGKTSAFSSYVSCIILSFI